MLDLSFFNGFYRMEGSSDGILKWDRDVDVLVTVFPPLILVEKSVVKLQALEATILGDMKNNIHEE